jgi:MFS family permease
MTQSSGADPELTKKSFRDQFRSLGYVYWLANWMELVERFAYYGVRVISPLFFVAAFEAGGPQLNQIQKGNIWAVWAVVQSFIPILSGGFADRYGFKVNLAASTVFKIIGYLIMGYTVFLAEVFAGMPLAEARPQGVDHAYEIFFVGAMFLAFGTAIFKPGLQGLVAMKIPRDSASLGWGLFYQMVNIGGFLGPLLAGYLRVLEWEYVFIACSAAISLNFIPLFMFKEPARERKEGEVLPGPVKLFGDALRGLLEPRLFFFTLAFAGFWLMAMQFFDILPNFIDDWVDARALASFLTGIFGEGAVPTVNGGNLTQEWLVNFNALLISCCAFLVGYLTGKFRSLTNIIAGIVLACIAIYSLGVTMNGWWILACIGLFSIGEMMSAPTKMRYLARIAPRGKDGLYMGYANFTVGIGWSIGSLVAGHLYEEGGDKVVLARRYLVDKMNLGQEEIAAIPKNELLPFFEKTVGVDAWETRRILWETYEPYSMWMIFALIGVVSMLALFVYNHVVKAADADPKHSFNTRGRTWVMSFLIPVSIALVAATFMQPSIGLGLNAAFFCMMLVVAFLPDSSADPVP